MIDQIEWADYPSSAGCEHIESVDALIEWLQKWRRNPHPLGDSYVLSAAITNILNSGEVGFYVHQIKGGYSYPIRNPKVRVLEDSSPTKRSLVMITGE